MCAQKMEKDEAHKKKLKKTKAKKRKKDVSLIYKKKIKDSQQKMGTKSDVKKGKQKNYKRIFPQKQCILNQFLSLNNCIAKWLEHKKIEQRARR